MSAAGYRPSKDGFAFDVACDDTMQTQELKEVPDVTRGDAVYDISCLRNAKVPISPLQYISAEHHSLLWPIAVATGLVSFTL